MLNTRVETRHLIVREGFQILLRADAVLCLPEESERIAAYYERTGTACLKWAEEAEGGRLRAAYLALESNRERSRFRAATYRLECRPVWENGDHAAWVCQSELCGQNGEPFVRRMSQVWNLREQTLLPTGQILHLCRLRGRKKHPPFRPDGVYPQGNELVFFQNAAFGNPIREFRASYE